MNPRKSEPRAPVPSDPTGPGRTSREYGHSSGDRNTRSKEDEWPDFRGGEQRDATPTRTPSTPGKNAV